jgi:mRNA interferase MazF
MGLFAAGQVVVLPFPYSDVIEHKLRPGVILAPAGHCDWVVCQITSNPYSDPSVIQITRNSFSEGGLRHTSYVRPPKLFTAHPLLIEAYAGTLKDEVFQQILDAVAAVFR